MICRQRSFLFSRMQLTNVMIRGWIFKQISVLLWNESQALIHKHIYKLRENSSSSFTRTTVVKRVSNEATQSTS